MDNGNRSNASPIGEVLGTTSSPAARTNTRRLALGALLTALFVPANAIPIDAFIGGAGFITAGILLLPVIARLLRPREAVVMAVLAAMGLLMFQLSIVPVFGFFGLLVPVIAIVMGSLGSHRSYLFPASYVLLGALWYLNFSGGTLLWLAPYVIAIALSVAQQGGLFRGSQRTETVVHTLDATMCELVTLNIGSISLLHLSGGLWTVITPFMFLERSIAVIGGSSILFTLAKIRGPLRLEGL